LLPFSVLLKNFQGTLSGLPAGKEQFPVQKYETPADLSARVLWKYPVKGPEVI